MKLPDFEKYINIFKKTGTSGLPDTGAGNSMNSDMRKLLIILACAVIVIAALARTLGHSETLSEYAAQHPGLQTTVETEDSTDTDVK